MADKIEIVRLTLADADAWARMAATLWPTEDAGVLLGEIDALVAREDYAAFGAKRPSGEFVGFIEVGARSVAEGCATSPVGYIEGMWVDAAARRRGIARQLVDAAIAWSRSRGYRELGSDTQTLERTVAGRPRTPRLHRDGTTGRLPDGP